MPTLVNLKQFGIEEGDLKVIISYLAIDENKNKDLITKLLKLGRYIKII